VFVTVSYFQLSLTLVGNLTSLPLKSLLVKVPLLSEIIRLGWKLLTVANTLAYHDTELITAEKSFIVQDVNVVKLLTSVIYKCS
jgi:hypothetical protein